MKNIGIVSLGLIGGSILKGLNQTDKYKIFAYSTNQKTVEKLQDYNNVSVAISLKDLKECEIIFVCSPINQTAKQIQEISKFVNKNCIISDVASYKTDIINDCKNLPCKFISTHPMAGTEKTGFDNSFADMFNNAKWVIIEEENQNETDLNSIKEIIYDLKANPIFTDYISHDRACAIISHTPALISQALVCTLLNESDKKINELARELASSGFRDTTRLALSNKTMIRDMLDFNYENIKYVLEKFIKNAESLLNNKEFYQKTTDKIIDLRTNMYK